MRKEKRWPLPHERQKIIEIIGSRRALAGGETLTRGNFVEQAELRVINKLPFLALFDGINR